jgi:hypothetical protein
MVSERYKNLWLQVFTHETFDYETNYETLETVGDSAFGYFFNSFLYNKYSDLNRAEITVLKSNIASKSSLRQVSWGLKMDKWLRMGGESISNTNTAEDLVEAFCAVIQMVFNDLYSEQPDFISRKPGHGYLILNSFIEFLFNNVTFTDVMFMGSPKMILNQSVQGITPNKQIIEIYERITEGKKDIHKIQLCWSDEMIAFFKKEGVKMDDFNISVSSSSKKAASSKAYHNAIDLLNDKGYTIKFLNSLKIKKQMEFFDEKLFRDVKAKANRSYPDYPEISFYAPKTLNTNNRVTVLLLCTKDDGSRKGKSIKLSMITLQKVELKNAQLQLFHKYLEEE